ncbi:MAG: class I SAM-dependent methyltransferase [Lachnospiraceae bacterium]|nr:class I SAM-dependent methyltransferase [Lachnospiraceae bacterium]
MNEIENWYDNQYEEWERLDRHKMEFEITKRYLREYIQAAPQKILDIGGGPGRYSLFLTERGHEVTLLDLSAHNIEVAKEKSAETGIKLKDYIKGDALKLPEFESLFDTVLLMGPLYHLTEEKDRIKAVDEAMSKLKPGGILFAAFISSYAPILDEIAYCEQGMQSTPEDLLHYLDDGRNKDGAGFTTAYFTTVEEARDMMRNAGLTELAFAGVENVFSTKERELMKKPEDFDKWMEIVYQLGRDPKLYGMSEHYLYIGKKE